MNQQRFPSLAQPDSLDLNINSSHRKRQLALPQPKMQNRQNAIKPVSNHPATLLAYVT